MRFIRTNQANIHMIRKEVNMGAICTDCKQDMSTADGCTWPLISKDGGKTWVGRRLDGFTRFDGERCHDCAALHGHVHHYGCDTERCPFCGGQLISCDCNGDGEFSEFSLGRCTEVEAQK